MRDFALGILGGCLTHQPGIAKSELYHRRVARRLADIGQARLLVRVARDFEHEPLQRLEALRRDHPLDGVLLHVRNSFTRKASLVTILTAESGIRYYLHPFLFRRWRRDWTKLELADFAGCILLYHRRRTGSSQAVPTPATGPAETPPVAADSSTLAPGATRVAGVALRDLFYLGGVMTGLDSWAVREELRLARELAARCRELALPLWILGPSRRPDDYWLDGLCVKLDQRLRDLAGRLAVPYTGLTATQDEQGERLYCADGFHLNSAGHAYVAAQLELTLSAWLDQFPAPTGGRQLHDAARVSQGVS